MNTISDKENKERLINKMGDATGGLFYLLHNEVCSLRMKFNDFKMLFGNGKKTIELLNKSCPAFFGNLQILMKDDLNLNLARLLDRRKNTASFHHLILSIADPTLKEKLSIKLADICNKAKENKRLRDNSLAHTNKHLRLNSKESLLYISRFAFKEIIVKLCDILNEISVHFGMARVMFEFLDESTNSKCLIFRLEDALEFEEVKKLKKRHG